MQSPMTRHDLLLLLHDELSEELTMLWRVGELDDDRFVRLSYAIAGEFLEDPNDYAMDALFYRVTKETTDANY